MPTVTEKTIKLDKDAIKTLADKSITQQEKDQFIEKIAKENVDIYF